jgi:hypothetical protein
MAPLSLSLTSHCYRYWYHHVTTTKYNGLLSNKPKKQDQSSKQAQINVPTKNLIVFLARHPRLLVQYTTQNKLKKRSQKTINTWLPKDSKTCNIDLRTSHVNSALNKYCSDQNQPTLVQGFLQLVTEQTHCYGGANIRQGHLALG